MPARRSIFAIAVGLTLVVGGCTAVPTASSPPPSPSLVVASPSAALPSVGPSPSAAAPSTAAPTETPSAAPATRPWSSPFAVHHSQTNDCSEVAGTYGPRTDIILVATCDGDIQITHGVSFDDWETLRIDGPQGIVLHGPQVAVDGDRLFVAADLLAPEDGGCGDPGLRQTGIRVWDRDLRAGGPWDDPVTVGGPDDSLQSFRVVRGVIHATVRDDETGEVAYVRSGGGQSSRTPIGDAVSTSLRVGSDGVARVAYTTSRGVWLANMDGGALDPESIYEGGDAFGPVLVLAGGNEPVLLWTVSFGGGGCAEPDPLPHHGTYVYSDVGGVAAADKLTDSQWASSLTLDIPGGTAYAVISESTDDRRGTYLYSRPIAGGTWTSKAVTDDLTGAVMRVDQPSGEAFLAWMSYEDDETRRMMVQTADLR